MRTTGRFGLAVLIALAMACASTGRYSGIDTEERQLGVPWSYSGEVMEVYFFNQTPRTTMHTWKAGEQWPFLWTLTSPAGVAYFHMMTGGDIPTAPCTLMTRQTDYRPY